MTNEQKHFLEVSELLGVIKALKDSIGNGTCRTWEQHKAMIRADSVISKYQQAKG